MSDRRDPPLMLVLQTDTDPWTPGRMHFLCFPTTTTVLSTTHVFSCHKDADPSLEFHHCSPVRTFHPLQCTLHPIEL